MARTLTQKLFERHLADATELPPPGEKVAVQIDQTLTQDATGTLVMLAYEALDVGPVATELSAQYVDHNLVQTDHRNPDDHLFLESAARRFGLHFSPPGTGVSHPLHMRHFGKPGATLLGSDSHTCAAGSLGMLAFGAGGLDVAFAMAGEPYVLSMPRVFGVELRGSLQPWVSAKDVILELLRRHDVSGGVGYVLEYFGPGVDSLSAMDRHVIANMGAELGATTSVFPSDERTRAFLERHGRGGDHEALAADEGATYDELDRIDLSSLVPLIALPSSPGNVVPVTEVEGDPIYQAYLGSSANPGFRDFAIAAEIVRDREVPQTVSFDVNPSSRALVDELLGSGHLQLLLEAGARLHQAGCNGCIGMGQAPASGRRSLRTVPRNFPDRSGTREDSVYLCSPETAAASALHGVITDPRTLPREPVSLDPPPRPGRIRPPRRQLAPPSKARPDLEMGPNIVAMPTLDALPDSLELEVLLDLGDDVSTDEILPAGTGVLPYRSNLPKIAEFCFVNVAPDYARRAQSAEQHAIVAGANYGQGSSREHAALAPRWLGLRAVVAESFARIHRRNLINYGVLPLLADASDLDSGDVLHLRDLQKLEPKGSLRAEVPGKDALTLRIDLDARELAQVKAGGRIAAHA